MTCVHMRISALRHVERGDYEEAWGDDHVKIGAMLPQASESLGLQRSWTKQGRTLP